VTTTTIERGCIGSESTTQGITVRVQPSWLARESSPAHGRWVFSYQVQVINGSDAPVKLVARRWTIVDADGDSHVVEGEGVVGQQPRLAPGESFRYGSYCPLATEWGTMEGTFTMLREDGSRFEAQVRRFYLVGSPE
jgi:ApaG protein